MMLPPTPWLDKDGNPTQAFRVFLQTLAESVGGPAYEIKSERIDDTTIRRKMKGADGVVRYGPNETLS